MGASIKRMHHTMTKPMTIRLDHRSKVASCVAVVQEHRQSKLFRQRELSFKVLLLSILVTELKPIIIEPALTHCHYFIAGCCYVSFQSLEVSGMTRFKGEWTVQGGVPGRVAVGLKLAAARWMHSHGGEEPCIGGTDGPCLRCGIIKTQDGVLTVARYGEGHGDLVDVGEAAGGHHDFVHPSLCHAAASER